MNNLLSLAVIFFQLHCFWKNKTASTLISLPTRTTLCLYIDLTAILYELKWETDLYHFPSSLSVRNKHTFLFKEGILPFCDDKCKSLSIFPLFAAHASLLPVSGCVGLPCASQCSPSWLPFPSAFPEALFTSLFSGWVWGVPLGSLWALLSTTTLGMGPCPAGLSFFLSFFNVQPHSL